MTMTKIICLRRFHKQTHTSSRNENKKEYEEANEYVKKIITDTDLDPNIGGGAREICMMTFHNNTKIT